MNVIQLEYNWINKDNKNHRKNWKILNLQFILVWCWCVEWWISRYWFLISLIILSSVTTKMLSVPFATVYYVSEILSYKKVEPRLESHWMFSSCIVYVFSSCDISIIFDRLNYSFVLIESLGTLLTLNVFVGFHFSIWKIFKLKYIYGLFTKLLIEMTFISDSSNHILRQYIMDGDSRICIGHLHSLNQISLHFIFHILPWLKYIPFFFFFYVFKGFFGQFSFTIFVLWSQFQ